MVWKRLLLSITIFLLVVTLVVNSLFVIGIIQKKCVAGYQKTMVCDFKTFPQYDKTFIELLENISSDINTTKPIAVSTDSPQIEFFMKVPSRVLYGAGNKTDIIIEMQELDSEYLLVIRGESAVRDLYSVFNASIIQNLEPEFVFIREYKSELRTINLFRRII